MNYELLFKTKPISQMPKMVVTAVYTMTNNNEQRTIPFYKRRFIGTRRIQGL
jgi:hypothetical protein